MHWREWGGFPHLPTKAAGQPGAVHERQRARPRSAPAARTPAGMHQLCQHACEDCFLSRSTVNDLFHLQHDQIGRRRAKRTRSTTETTCAPVLAASEPIRLTASLPVRASRSPGASPDTQLSGVLDPPGRHTVDWLAKYQKAAFRQVELTWQQQQRANGSPNLGNHNHARRAQAHACLCGLHRASRGEERVRQLRDRAGGARECDGVRVQPPGIAKDLLSIAACITLQTSAKCYRWFVFK